MNNEEVSKRVGEIHLSLRKLKEELGTIKENCSHDNYHIGNWSWRVGAIDLARICNYCQDNIGEPNEEEISNLMKEND